MTMLGADPVALRELSQRLLAAAAKLDHDATTLGRAIETSPWSGPDSERFRDDWRSQHSSASGVTAERLRVAYESLVRNASEQEHASDTYTAQPATQTAEHHVSPSRTSLSDLWSPIGFTLKALKANKLAKLGGSFLSAMKLAGINSAARSALTHIPQEAVKLVTETPAWLGKLGPLSKVATTAGKWLGPIGGVISIGTGIYQMVNPEHQGALGVGDRVAGGLSTVSGVATLLLFTPLAATPVGPVLATVAIGAGLLSAGWNLGMAIHDNWGNITKFGSDVWDGTKAVASAAVEGVKNTVSGTIDAVKDAAGKVGDFFKGIFG